MSVDQTNENVKSIKQKRYNYVTNLWNKDYLQAKPHPELQNTYVFQDINICNAQVCGKVVGSKDAGRSNVFMVDDGTAVMNVLYRHKSEHLQRFIQHHDNLSYRYDSGNVPEPTPNPDCNNPRSRKVNADVVAWMWGYPPDEISFVNKMMSKIKHEQDTAVKYYDNGEVVIAFGSLFVFDDELTVGAFTMSRITEEQYRDELRNRRRCCKSINTPTQALRPLRISLNIPAKR